jgi:hypothetical protein
MQKYITGLLTLFAPLITSAHGGEHMVAQVPFAATLTWTQTIGLAIVAGTLVMGLFFFLKTKKITSIASGIGVAVITLSMMAASQSSYHSQMVASVTQNEEMHMELQGAKATVYRSPGCECCKGYIAALEKQGVEVEMIEVTGPELVALKAEKGVPTEMESCHTTIMDGYVIEGHVPFEAVAKLRAERPAIAGIGLPGMPIGTPGMPGPKTEAYVVRTLSGESFLTL